MSLYQIIAAITEIKGENAYLYSKCEFYFGARFSYHTNKNNIGVERSVEPTRKEILSEIVGNERLKRGLTFELQSFFSLKLSSFIVEERYVS